MISSLQISADLSICIGTGDVRTSPVADSGWCFGKNDGFFLITNENNFDHKIQQKINHQQFELILNVYPFPKYPNILHTSSLYSTGKLKAFHARLLFAFLHSARAGAAVLAQDLLSSLLCPGTENHISRCEDFWGLQLAASCHPNVGQLKASLCRELVSFVLLVPTKAGNKILLQFQSWSEGGFWFLGASCTSCLLRWIS